MLDQELDKCQNMNQQKQNDEKELLLKLNLEIEDKEKAQHDLHNYKKQVRVHIYLPLRKFTRK